MVGCGLHKTGFEDKDTSEDAFLQARAAANDSSVMIHTVMWIDNKGNNMEKPACYIHPIPAEQAE